MAAIQQALLMLSAPTGPYTGNKLLHCSFEGTNGDTSWPDLSPFARTIIGNTDLQLSSARSKWGTTSLRMTSKDPDAIILSGTEWGRATAQRPYSIAFWLWHTTSENFTAAPIITRWVIGSQADSIAQYSSLPYLQYGNEGFGDEMAPAIYTSGQWVYVFCGFDGTTTYLAIDGVIVYSALRSLSAATSGTFYLGGLNASGTGTDATQMYISDLLVLDNQCLYTAAFTPPTAPHA